VNPPALYDALNCASLAVLAAEAGDVPKADTSILEAPLAAPEAFPAGSREAEALSVILAAVARVPEAEAVT
jgi:hypothetical protein